MPKKKRKSLKKASPVISTKSLWIFAAIFVCSLLFLPLKKTEAPRHPEKKVISADIKVKHQAQGPQSAKITKQDTGPEQKTKSNQGTIALIIDDMGNQLSLGKQFIDLDLPLSFAILPNTPFAEILAQKASEKGRDILLHLPMEPENKKWQYAPETLQISMPKAQIEQNIENFLANVPLAIGINNHMGSLFTENNEKMSYFLKYIKPKKLFFVDSYTSSKTMGYRLAKSLGIKTAKRDVFIDNMLDEREIFYQLNLLVLLAKKNSEAIGIGHPHKETLAALKMFKEQLADQVNIVGIHNLVK